MHLQMTKVAKVIISHFGRVENTMGKGENAGFPSVLLSKAFFFRVIKSQDCVVES